MASDASKIANVTKRGNTPAICPFRKYDFRKGGVNGQSFDLAQTPGLQSLAILQPDGQRMSVRLSQSSRPCGVFQQTLL